MQITYAGTVIAKEPPVFGGTERVTGFTNPSGEAQVQVEFMPGADWATRFDRGNKTLILTGTITYAPFDTLEACAESILQFFAGLPTAGVLLIQESTTAGTQFADAKLKSFSTPMRVGLSYAVQLVFDAGEPEVVAIS